MHTSELSEKEKGRCLMHYLHSSVPNCGGCHDWWLSKTLHAWPSDARIPAQYVSLMTRTKNAVSWQGSPGISIPSIELVIFVSNAVLKSESLSSTQHRIMARKLLENVQHLNSSTQFLSEPPEVSRPHSILDQLLSAFFRDISILNGRWLNCWFSPSVNEISVFFLSMVSDTVITDYSTK